MPQRTRAQLVKSDLRNSHQLVNFGPSRNGRIRGSSVCKEAANLKIFHTLGLIDDEVGVKPQLRMQLLGHRYMNMYV